MYPTDLSPKGALFIIRREAICLSPYADGMMPDPKTPDQKIPRWSIAMGCLAKHGERTKPVTVKKSFSLLHKEVGTRIHNVVYALGIRQFTKPPVPVLQQHVDAVFSLYYQGGSDGLKSVSRLVREGKMQEAADDFLRWDEDEAGNPKEGLKARRELERHLFLTGDYGELNPVRLYRVNPHAHPTAFELYNVTEDDLKGWLERIDNREEDDL